MATEKKRVIDIDTAAAEQAVKNLSQSVKEMSKNLGKIDSTAKKFQSALDNLTKSEADVAKSAQELNTATETLNNSVGNGLTNATTQSGNSVKELRTRLKELRTTLMDTEAGTSEYNAALNEASTIQHQLREQMVLINNSAVDFGQAMSNITKVTQGVIGGLQSAKAVMNLFGIENKEVIESLKQMQNLMALTQALPAIDNGIKAFKRLTIQIQALTGATSAWGKALISTGLGALVVGVGLLINYLMRLRDRTNEAAEAQRKLNEEWTKKTTETAQNRVERQLRIIERLGQIEGKKQSEIYQDDINYLTKIVDLLNQYKLAYDNVLLSKQALASAEERGDSNIAAYQAVVNRATEALKKLQEQVRTELGTDFMRDEVLIVEDLNKRIIQYANDVKKLKEQIADEKIIETREDEIKATEEASKAEKKLAEEQEKAAKKNARSYEYEKESLEDLLNVINKRASATPVGDIFDIDLLYYEEQLKSLTKAFDEIDKELAFINKELETYSDIQGQESYINSLKNRRDELNKLGSSYKEMYDEFVLMSKSLNQVYEEMVSRTSNYYVDYIPKAIDEMNRAYEKLRTNIRKDFNEMLPERGFLDKSAGEYLVYYNNIQKEIRAINEAELINRRDYLFNYMESIKKVAEEYLATLDVNSLEYAQALNVYLQELYKAEQLYNQTQSDILNIHNEKLQELRDKDLEHLYLLQDAFYNLSDAMSNFTSVGGNSFGLNNLMNTIGQLIPMFDDLVVKAGDSQEEIAKYSAAIAATFLNGVSSMFSTLASEQDKETEAGFQRAKDFEIVSAVINTLSGVVSAWSGAMQLGPIAGPILGAALSAMMIGIGAANIKKIQQQQFGSANASSLGGANAGAVSNITAPVQFTQDIQGADIEGLIKDQRVYVLESDISNVQHKVRVSEAEAIF